MSLLGFILMVVAGIGAVIGNRMAKAGNKQGIAVAVPCAILGVTLAVVGLVKSGDSTSKLAKSLGHYGYACGDILGQYLARHHSGERVLLLVEPTFEHFDPDLLQVAIEEGLKDGMGGALQWVGTVPVDPPPAYVKRFTQAGAEPHAGGPVSSSIPFELRSYQSWFSTGYLAALLKKHRGTYDVLVSAVGLPAGFHRSRLTRAGQLPETIAVLNAPGAPMKMLIESEVVDVLVAFKPTDNPWKDAQSAPHDTAEAFNKRFLLVTKTNLEEVARAYPTSPHWR